MVWGMDRRALLGLLSGAAGLALGATAVGVGRPYVWGLGAFGQPGVEKVLDILTREFELIMKQSGVTSVEAINRNYIAKAL